MTHKFSAWIHEEASARRYQGKREAARIVTMITGRCLWSAWKLTGEEAQGTAKNAQEAKDAADRFLGINT